MQLPITIGLHRSFLLTGGIGLSHAAAALIMFLPNWPVAAVTLATILVLGSAAWSVWRCRSEVVALRLLADGRLEYRRQGEKTFALAELQPTATVHPLLTVLRLKVANATLSVVVAPDSGRIEELRQLRIWLRWRADFKAAAGREE